MTTTVRTPTPDEPATKTLVTRIDGRTLSFDTLHWRVRKGCLLFFTTEPRDEAHLDNPFAMFPAGGWQSVVEQ